MGDFSNWRHAGYFAAGALVTATLVGGAAHAVTDTIFKYTTPKTGYLSVDPVGLMPLTHDDADAYGIYYVYDGVTTTTRAYSCFGKSVELPQGAKVTALAGWYQRGMRLSLYRHSPAQASSEVIADRVFKTTETTVRPGTVAIDAARATINNQRYTYALIMCLPETSNNFFGARVTYTYTTAGD
jgi:hypothetical protein